MNFDLPEGWTVKTLSECCTETISYGIVQPGKHDDNGVPVVRVNNFSRDGLELNEVLKVSPDISAKFKRTVLRGGEVLLTLVGSTGQSIVVPESMKGWNVPRAIAVIRVASEVGADWVNICLQSPATKYFLDSRANTTVQKTLNLKDVKEIPILLPPDEYKNTALSTLISLNEKLALNTQTNQTLEEMAQAIFKSWFVDFDPVKAKMNGEQPEGMDAATASLFPEKLDSETGIPNGWTQGSIADIAKLNANSWTKKNSPEQVHYVDLANTKNGVIESVTTYDFEESPSRARRILNSGDTIVGTVRPGNRSYAFIGDTEKPLTGSTGFAVLSPKKSYWTSFVYLATTNDDSIDEYARLADGGAYPAIKPAVVADTQCTIPTEDIAMKFWELTGPMLRKAHQNRLQNEDLAALRDTLLPKLLSGDVKLSDPIVKVGEIG